jgi:2-phospho-L-lactate guanylyltransferase
VSRPLVAIPVKPFEIAKRRLSNAIPEEVRPALSERLAQHTLEVVRATTADPLILSADAGVTGWARAVGAEVLLDEGSSLNEAAGVAVEVAISSGVPWAVLHADLPLLTPADLQSCVTSLERDGAVLAASSDGGTSLIGATTSIDFSYGPGSFHRHLAALRHEGPAIVSNVGLALDLDEPEDLHAALGHPGGAWLREIIDTVR